MAFASALPMPWDGPKPTDAPAWARRTTFMVAFGTLWGRVAPRLFCLWPSRCLQGVIGWRGTRTRLESSYLGLYLTPHVLGDN